MTTFNEIYKPFFYKIVNDKNFFGYADVDAEEALEIAKDRSQYLLMESISRLTLKCTPDVDFFDYDLTLCQFNFNLTQNEVELLNSLMREKLFEQDELKLKVIVNRFSTKDVNFFSPSNERKTFMDFMVNLVKQNDIKIDNYASRDRLTGKYKMLKFEYE